MKFNNFFVKLLISSVGFIWGIVLLYLPGYYNLNNDYSRIIGIVSIILIVICVYSFIIEIWNRILNRKNS